MAKFNFNFDWKKLRRFLAATDLGIDLGSHQPHPEILPGL